MRALVTGGAGFIGSHIAAALVVRGDSVVVLDDFSSGRAENLSGFEGSIQIVQGSVLDEATVMQAGDGCEAIFHLAAVASVQRSVEDPVGTGRTNAEAAVRILESARKTGAKVILSSSSAVYGDTESLPVDERELPRTLSPYAVHKLASEGYMQTYHAMHSVRSVSLRYFNVYGPRQDPNSEYAAVVPKFVTRALEGRPLIIYGDGGQTRDFVFVDDIVRANFLALESPVSDGKPLNIGSGQSISILELAETILESLGSKSQIDRQPARLGEVRYSECNADHAAEAIGFRTQVPLKDGIERTAEYWRSLIQA